MVSGILGAVGHRGVGTLTAVVWYNLWRRDTCGCELATLNKTLLFSICSP